MKINQIKDSHKLPKDILLSDALDKIRYSDISQHVADLREYIPTVMSTEKITMKKIPQFIFAGTFKQNNGELNFLCYTGLVLLEMKPLTGIAEAANLRLAASQLGQTMAAFVGASGRSVKILVKFTLPDGSLPTTESDAVLFHAEAYRRAATYYEMQLQRSVTKSEPYLSRPCRCSYDPDLYYNPQASVINQPQPLTLPQEHTWEQKIQQRDDPMMRMLPGYDRSNLIAMLFETALQETRLTPDLPRVEEDPKPFMIELARNCFRSGIPEEETIRWTRFAVPKDTPEALVRLTVVNTFQAGRNFGGNPAITREMLLAIRTDEFMQRRYELRFNEFRCVNEYRDRQSFYFSFSPVDDRVVKSMVLDAHQENIPAWDKDINRYLGSNRIPSYNPIDHFLQHLPKWDDVDHIKVLARTLPNENPVWEQLFYRWFLGMVRNWQQFDSKHANSLMPMLIGRQGDGKSNWCRNILPPVLQAYYAESMDLSNRSKAEMMLAQYVLVNLDEFDSISNSQHAFLKHLISKASVSTRKPYKQAVQQLRRYVSFIATGNFSDMLTDPSGSRRFLGVEIIGKVPHNLDINYNQLYAQATHALAQGERYWIDSEEQTLSEEQNEAFENQTFEEQLFLQYFRPAVDETEGKMMPMVEIIQQLEIMSGRKISTKKANYFGRILNKHKVIFKRNFKTRLYRLVQL